MMPDVSRETSERLAVLQRLILKWSTAINLVAPEDLPELGPRHIDDCLQLAALLPAGRIVDLGSGGGLPGLVVAAATEGLPRAITLIESDQRKAAFLRTAIREMTLSEVSVLANRSEDVAPQGADALTARALAPLPKLLGLAHRHLREGGMALLMKGRRWRSEVDEARHMWDFTLDAIPSTSQHGAAILHVTNLQPR